VTKTATQWSLAPPLPNNIRPIVFVAPLPAVTSSVLVLLLLPIQPCFASQQRPLDSCRRANLWKKNCSAYPLWESRRRHSRKLFCRKLVQANNSAAQSNLVDFRPADGHQNTLPLILASLSFHWLGPFHLGQSV
jgi:hypothetical protein